MKDSDVPECECICCKKKLDTARSLEDCEPKCGDLTFCIHCGMIMQFNEKLLLERIPEKELEEIKKTDAWKEVEKVWEHISKLL